MASTEFIIYGDVNISVTITDMGDGEFYFDVAVITEGENYTGQIGELNGFWFNLPTGTDYGALTIEGAQDYQLAEDEVNKLDGGVNLNGEVIKDNGGDFDAGILIDDAGLAGTEGTLSTSFILSDSSGTLTLADFTSAFEDQYYGVRLTSVGDPEGERDGSLKLGGEPTDEIIDKPPTDPVNVANDDIVYAFEDAEFGIQDEFLEFGDTVLDNDTTDGGAYGGLVVTPADGIAVAGTNGGSLIVYSDGTIDFSAGDDFVELNDGDFARTEFTYSIDGGSSATIIVEVEGISGDEDIFLG